MMNYQSTPRSNRPRGFVVRNVLQFTLFIAFSLWLLYQIRQPNSDGGSHGIQLSTDGIPNLLGRKGSAGLSKSTPGLTLEDVTNPGEEGEIPRYSKEIPEVEFRLKKGSVKEGNDENTLLHGHTRSNKDGGPLTMAKSKSKSNITFPDENGIPQHVRDKFVGTETSESGNGTRVGIQSVIATRDGVRGNGTREES